MDSTRPVTFEMGWGRPLCPVAAGPRIGPPQAMASISVLAGAAL